VALGAVLLVELAAALHRSGVSGRLRVGANRRQQAKAQQQAADRYQERTRRSF
jgi:hypothetical protein